MKKVIIILSIFFFDRTTKLYLINLQNNGTDIDLSEYFITSKANAKPMIKNDKFFKLDEVKDVQVLVTKAKGKKCSRCWKILESPCQRNNCGLKN